VGFIIKREGKKSNQLRRQGPAFSIGVKEGETLLSIPAEEGEESDVETAFDVDSVGVPESVPLSMEEISLLEGTDCKKPKLRVPLTSGFSINEEYYTELSLVANSNGDIVYSGNADEPEPGSGSGGPQVSEPSGPKIGDNPSFWVEKVNDAITGMVDRDRNVHTEDLIDRTVAGWEISNPNWAADIIRQVETGFREQDSSFYINETNFGDFAEVDVLGIPNENLSPELKYEIGFGEMSGFVTGVEAEHGISTQASYTQLNVIDAATSYHSVMRQVW
jgi:hypothetical protein